MLNMLWLLGLFQEIHKYIIMGFLGVYMFYDFLKKGFL